MDIQKRTAVLWIIAILGFVCSFFSNMLISFLGDKHYSENGHVFDLGFKLFPKMDDQLVDLLVLGAPFLYVYLRKTLKSSKIPGFWREVILIFGLVLCLRVATTMSTILPMDEDYEADENSKCSFKDYTIRNYLFGGCYDKIFSGHISFVMVLCLTAVRHGVINKREAGAIVLFSSFIIISTRSHFTVDVVLGIFLSFAVFQMAHMFIDKPASLRQVYKEGTHKEIKPVSVVLGPL